MAVVEHEREALADPRDVAEFLGVSTKTLRNWRASGRGPRYLRVGGVKYAWSEVEEWVEAQRGQGGGQ